MWHPVPLIITNYIAIPITKTSIIELGIMVTKEGWLLIQEDIPTSTL